VIKFNVLDDISLAARSLLLLVCGLTCCWGFVNDTILLVFASKVGFPIAVASCAISNNRKQILSVLYYTAFLVLVGTVYFAVNDYEITTSLTKNFVPTLTDLLLAVGLGGAMSYFWNHTIRINIIVMSAGLASLLPACIMAGYWISHGIIPLAVSSLLLYFQYVLGMALGCIIINYLRGRK
jgi:hypothetical protein